MARKSRYIRYIKGVEEIKEAKYKTTKKSLLKELTRLKGQEFKLIIPIGGMDGQ